MIRSLHRWPGVIAAVLLAIVALSGTVLSTIPAIDAARSGSVANMTVADLATTIANAHSGVEEIRRAPSGLVTATYADGDAMVTAVVDPATGAEIAAARRSALNRATTCAA